MRFMEALPKWEIIYRLLDKVPPAPPDTSFGLENIKSLCRLAERLPRGAHILEFGSLFGRSAFSWALAVKDSLVWTVDIEDRIDEINRYARELEVEKQIIPIVCDSVKFEWKKRFDVVFIDANHIAENLRVEIQRWDSKADILICGHDYGHPDWPDVKKIVDEFYGDKVDKGYGDIWVVWKKGVV